MTAGLDYYAHMTRPVQRAATWRTCPERCGDLGHPGCTWNPIQGKTWCLCGQVVRDGNAVDLRHMDCCGGPLTEPINPKEASCH